MPAAWPSPYIAALHQYSVNRKTGLSPWPVGHELPAPVLPQACTGLITCNFTVHSDLRTQLAAIRLLLPATSVILGFLRFKAERIGGFPTGLPAAAPAPIGLFSHSERLLLRPEVPYFLMRTTLRYMFVVDGFRLPWAHHCTQADLHRQVSLRGKAEPSMHLEALACFVHRVGRRHDSNIIFSMFRQMGPVIFFRSQESVINSIFLRKK